MSELEHVLEQIENEVRKEEGNKAERLERLRALQRTEPAKPTAEEERRRAEKAEELWHAAERANEN